MKRPYIALGVTQQGRTVPTLLARATARGRGLVQQYLIADDPHDNPWDVPPPADMPLRQGWEAEPIDPGHRWGRYAAIVLLSALCFWVLTGCTVMRIGPPDEAPALVWASCPPLGDLKRTDPEALRLRVAEVEMRYEQCRNAALEPRP